MAYKSVELTSTVGGCVADAFAAYEELAGEMRETADNMEGANMGHMQKCTDCAEAADELEEHTEIDVPEFLADIPVKTSQMLNKNKKRGPSRSVRLSNAQRWMQDARAAVEQFASDVESNFDGLDEKDQTDEAREKMESQKEDAEQFISDLDEHCEFDVNFPGMFG